MAVPSRSRRVPATVATNLSALQGLARALVGRRRSGLGQTASSGPTARSSWALFIFERPLMFFALGFRCTAGRRVFARPGPLWNPQSATAS